MKSCVSLRRRTAVPALFVAWHAGPAWASYGQMRLDGLLSVLLLGAALLVATLGVALCALGAYRRLWLALPAALLATALAVLQALAWQDLRALLRGFQEPWSGLVLLGVLALFLFAIVAPLWQASRGRGWLTRAGQAADRAAGLLTPAQAQPWPRLWQHRTVLLLPYLPLLPWLYFGGREHLRGLALEVLERRAGGARVPAWLPLDFLMHDGAAWLWAPLVCLPLGLFARRPRLFTYLLAVAGGLLVGMLLTWQWPQRFPMEAWLGSDPLIPLLTGYGGFLAGAGLARRAAPACSADAAPPGGDG